VVHWQPDYKKLFDTLKLYGGKRAPGLVVNGPVFRLSGRVNPSGDVTILGSSVANNVETTRPDPDGPYALVFGSGGSTLGRHRFHVGDPDTTFRDDWRPRSLFNVAAALPEGTGWIELRRSGTVLARLEPSVHAPEVRLDYPNGGEVFDPSETVTVRWTSSDADGGTLTHDLYYSPDGGGPGAGGRRHRRE